MSALSQVFTTCPDLQADLDTVWQTGPMIGADERMPFLQFITSPVNRQGISTAMIPGGGKVRNFEVVYMQRKTEDTVNTNQPNPNCGTGEDPGDLSTTYTLDTDENIQTDGFSLTAEQLEANCRNNGQTFLMLMQREMDVLRRAVASELASQAVALAGGWSDFLASGTNPGQVNGSNEFVMRTIASGAINTTGWTQLWNALTDSGMGTNPAIFCGTTIREYFQLSQSGCCANEGLDIGALFQQWGFAVAHDVRIQKALGGGTYASGAGDGLVVIPGALQLLEYNRAPWKGQFGMPAEASNYYHSVVADPMSGLQFDVTMQDNCGTVTVNLTWTGKLIGLPADMFATGDPYEGITGVAKVTTSNT